MYDKDMVAASIYLNEDANVKSWYFKIEAEEVNDFCARNEQLANAMQCQKFTVVCTKKEDKVFVSFTGAGAHVVKELTCEKILADQPDGWGKTWDQLQAIASAGKSHADFKTFTTRVSADNWAEKTYDLAGEKGYDWKAKLRSSAYLKWRTNDNACYVGQHTPMKMPACTLFKGDSIA